MNTHIEKFYCGYVAIIGRPNVGKSTLLNHLIGQKLSITSNKPQTTRHRILGIKTTETTQAIYVDTPGMHHSAGRALNRYMNRAANSAIYDVNVILFLIEGMQWTEDDSWILKKVATAEVPVILIVNKIDKINDRKKLLPYLQELAQKGKFAEIVPMSAKKNSDIAFLEQVIYKYLPEQPPIFPADQITDLSSRFFAAEIIREKLMRHLGQELPYAVTVEIEEYKVEDEKLRISAVIYVEKAGQKAIVIGAKGERLKQIGTEARLDMQKLFEQKIFLRLWVKVKQGWRDSERSLQSLGYSSPKDE